MQLKVYPGRNHHREFVTPTGRAPIVLQSHPRNTGKLAELIPLAIWGQVLPNSSYFRGLELLHFGVSVRVLFHLPTANGRRHRRTPIIGGTGSFFLWVPGKIPTSQERPGSLLDLEPSKISQVDTRPCVLEVLPRKIKTDFSSLVRGSWSIQGRTREEPGKNQGTSGQLVLHAQCIICHATKGEVDSLWAVTRLSRLVLCWRWPRVRISQNIPYSPSHKGGLRSPMICTKIVPASKACSSYAYVPSHPLRLCS